MKKHSIEKSKYKTIKYQFIFEETKWKSERQQLNNYMIYTLWLFNIAMENDTDPFTNDLWWFAPSKIGDVPVRYVKTWKKLKTNTMHVKSTTLIGHDLISTHQSHHKSKALIVIYFKHHTCRSRENCESGHFPESEMGESGYINHETGCIYIYIHWYIMVCQQFQGDFNHETKARFDIDRDHPNLCTMSNSTAGFFG